MNCCRTSPKTSPALAHVEKDKPSNALPLSTSAMVFQKNSYSNSFQSVGADMFPRNMEMGVPFKVRRTNESVKVKVIPGEAAEAMYLKSGSKAVTQVGRVNWGFPTKLPDPLSATCKSSEVVSKLATSKSLLPTETSNFRAYNGAQTSTMAQQAVEMSNLLAGEEHPPGLNLKQSAIGSVAIAKGAGDRPGKPVSLTEHAEVGSSCSVVKPKELRGNEVSFVPRRVSVEKGQSNVAIVSKDVETSRMPEKSASNFVTALPRGVNPPPVSSSGSDCRSGAKSPRGPSSSCAAVHERNLQNISPNFQRPPLSGPALEVIWKGNFEVLDFPHDRRIFEGFLAHLSAKVSRKAYEFTRQIPGVLQFRIHPRHAFWPEIFQSDCPDANDIALFFYPGKIERSKWQYAKLLKHMEKHDLMLRSLMGHVELLVFPSKLLHVDSQKLDGMSYFMWGVFRHLKGEKVAKNGESSSSFTRCSMTSNSTPETKTQRGRESSAR